MAPAIVLLLIFTLVFIRLERGEDLKAGLLLGLGLISFQIVLPFALILLLRRKWQVIAGLCLSITWLAYRSWQVRGTLRYGFSCAVVASILASFHLYDYDLLLLLLPILLMAGEIRQKITKTAVAILYLPVYRFLVQLVGIYWLYWPVAVFAASLFGMRKAEQVCVFSGVDHGDFGRHPGLQRAGNH